MKIVIKDVNRSGLLLDIFKAMAVYNACLCYDNKRRFINRRGNIFYLVNLPWPYSTHYCFCFLFGVGSLGIKQGNATLNLNHNCFTDFFIVRRHNIHNLSIVMRKTIVGKVDNLGADKNNYC